MRHQPLVLAIVGPGLVPVVDREEGAGLREMIDGHLQSLRKKRPRELSDVFKLISYADGQQDLETNDRRGYRNFCLSGTRLN